MYQIILLWQQSPMPLTFLTSWDRHLPRLLFLGNASQNPSTNGTTNPAKNAGQVTRMSAAGSCIREKFVDGLSGQSDSSVFVRACTCLHLGVLAQVSLTAYGQRISSGLHPLTIARLFLFLRITFFGSSFA
jgi:hypothetical protein